MGLKACIRIIGVCERVPKARWLLPTSRIDDCYSTRGACRCVPIEFRTNMRLMYRLLVINFTLVNERQSDTSVQTGITNTIYVTSGTDFVHVVYVLYKLQQPAASP